MKVIKHKKLPKFKRTKIKIIREVIEDFDWFQTMKLRSGFKIVGGDSLV